MYNQNGVVKIYKMFNSVNNKCYVGSTRKTIKLRLQSHLRMLKLYNKIGEKWLTAYDIINEDPENLKIELLEEFDFTNNKERFKRERYWIEKLDTVNKVIPTRTKKEYMEMDANRYSNNYCDCGGSYRPRHMSTHNKTIRHKNYLKKMNKNIHSGQ